MRWILILFPAVLGLLLLGFNNDRLEDRVPVLVLQFVVLSVISVLTLSWISNLVKTPLVVWAFVFLGIGNLTLAFYLFFTFWDGYVSLPFFLLSSWCFFKVKS